jgi:hypothetical protein
MLPQVRGRIMEKHTTLSIRASNAISDHREKATPIHSSRNISACTSIQYSRHASTSQTTYKWELASWRSFIHLQPAKINRDDQVDLIRQDFRDNLQIDIPEVWPAQPSRLQHHQYHQVAERSLTYCLLRQPDPSPITSPRGRCERMWRTLPPPRSSSSSQSSLL